jgi:hypothetical protein
VRLGALVVKKERFNLQNTKKSKPPKHEKKCILLVGFGALVVKKRKDLTTKTLKKECHQNTEKMIGGIWCIRGKKKEGFNHQNTKMRKPPNTERNVFLFIRKRQMIILLNVAFGNDYFVY